MVFNLSALSGGAKASLRCLLTQDNIYRGLLNAGKLTSMGLSDEDFKVSLSSHMAQYRMPPQYSPKIGSGLAGARFQGGDYQTLEVLSGGFKKAEIILRGRSWNRSNVNDAIEVALEHYQLLVPISNPGVGRRLKKSFGTVPSSVWISTFQWLMAPFMGAPKGKNE